MTAADAPGSAPVDNEGMVVFWHIRTPDTAAGRAFYGKLFGWEFMEINELTFAVQNRGRMIGCLLAEAKRSEAPGSVLYVQVADLSGKIGQALELGAEVVSGPASVPGGRAFADLRDPTGTTFGLWTENWAG